MFGEVSWRRAGRPAMAACLARLRVRRVKRAGLRRPEGELGVMNLKRKVMKGQGQSQDG
jgi:hypothetical protein